MSEALLAREAELHRRNADLDAAVASVRMRLATVEPPPLSPPRDLATDRDASFASASTPQRQGHPDPLSPPVRAAAAASAARRVSENRGGFAVQAPPPRRPSSSSLIPKPGRAARDGAGAPVGSDDEAPVTLLEDVDPALPTDVQLRLLRSQLKIARKELADQRAGERSASQRAHEAEKHGSAEGAERARLAKALAASEAALEKSKRAAWVCLVGAGDWRVPILDELPRCLSGPQ